MILKIIRDKDETNTVYYFDNVDHLMDRYGKVISLAPFKIGIETEYVKKRVEEIRIQKMLVMKEPKVGDLVHVLTLFYNSEKNETLCTHPYDAIYILNNEGKTIERIK